MNACYIQYILMKVRFTKPTGCKLMVHFAGDKPSIEVARFDVMFRSMEDMPEQYRWEALKEKYPDMNGCGPLTIWDTPSEELEPGCLYYDYALPENMYWDNHHGPHLHVVCPNGNHWNIDSRASNCGSPDNKTHRCWVRHGDPESGIVHVDKSGETCSAGAGSIIAGDYHGFLHNGKFTSC